MAKTKMAKGTMSAYAPEAKSNPKTFGKVTKKK